MKKEQEIKANVTIEIRDAKTGQLKTRDEYHNMVVTAAKTAIATRLAGGSTNDVGTISYIAVGTGTTSPALSDVALQTELARKELALRSSTSNVATFTGFFGVSEGNGVLREAALFGDAATSTAGTGTMYCRVAINRTKSSSDTLSLTWTFTLL